MARKPTFERIVLSELGVMKEMLQVIINQNHRELRREAFMSQEIDDLVSAVENLTTIDEGIALAVDNTVAFETELKRKLDEALNAPTVDLAAIRAATASLGTQTAALAQKKQELADAIVANTPAATP
jgi:chromosome segregation ATPase